MIKKADNKYQKNLSEAPSKKGSSIFDYLRFGESYTSLILGIIVVIIATALLLSFVHNKNAGQANAPVSQQTQNSVQVSQNAQDLAKRAPSGIIDNAVSVGPDSSTTPSSAPTAEPTAKPQPTAEPTAKPQPTAKPTAEPTAKPQPTVRPTAEPTAKPAASELAMAKPQPTAVPQVKTDKDNNVWVVQKGESLWTIAEKVYTSGYNWVDIAKANHLSDPSDIHVGDRLVLPKVKAKTPTISVAASQAPPTQAPQKPVSHVAPSVHVGSPITGGSYTVVRGDNLWNIAVRAYGNGFRYGDIARANNLNNPHMIFSGNKLTIPRP